MCYTSNKSDGRGRDSSRLYTRECLIANILLVVCSLAAGILFALMLSALGNLLDAKVRKMPDRREIFKQQLQLIERKQK